MSGIDRNIDNLGRVVIPKEWRDKLKIANGDAVTISFDGKRLTIVRAKAETSCECACHG